MGEAKRRKKFDPNYGKSNILKNVCQHIDSFLLQSASTDDDRTIFSLFTNKDRGCTEQEIELLKKEIPSLYQGKKFSLWVLPKKSAHLPVEKALNHFVRISIGMSET